jgi:hypothetical protein
MCRFRWLAMLLVLGLLALVASGRADDEGEKKVDLTKLPKEVRQALKDKYPGAKLIKASEEKEDDQTLYEVGLTHKDHNYSVLFKPDGSIVEIEKEIPAKDLPAVVAKAIEEKYPKATFKRTEEVTKMDKFAFYEVLLVTADKKTFELEVAADGKILKTTSKDKKKDEKKDKKKDTDK